MLTIDRVGTVVCAVVGAGVTAVAAPVVLGAVGFTSAGVAVGSPAAWIMSSVAKANGGKITAGGIVAILQSLGARGIFG